MLPRWNRGWLLLLLLPQAPCLAAAPEAPPTSRTGLTVAEVDRVVDSMMQNVWRLSQPEQDDARNQGIAADVARFVLSDATLKEIESLRAGLAQTVDPDTGRIPQAAIAPLELIVQRENCSMATILSHWSDEVLWPLRTDMQGALARLPAARREAFDREIAGIVAAASPDRKQMESDVEKCASLERGEVPAYMRRIETAALGLAALRRRLAMALDEGLRTGEIEQVRQLRPTPCPSPRSPAPGNSRPQLAREDASTNAYPALARTMGIEGTVRVRIEIDAGGCVVAATVLGTSASEMLDQAAIRRALGQEWVPAEVNGEAAPYAAVMPVSYRLREE